MNEDKIPHRPEDVSELKRFKTVVRTMATAECVQIPDVRFLQPNRDHHHYDLHVTEPTGMTVINTYHFKTKEACLEAIDHTKQLLPQEEENELENSEATEENPQDSGTETEGPETGVESYSAPSKGTPAS